MISGDMIPWIIFFVGIAVLVGLDFVFVGRHSEVMSTRSALAWSAAWISLGLAFSLAVWSWHGSVAAQEYLTAYLIEESLSIDNLFVFVVVFSSLGIALRYQRRVLFWGIYGAIVMRGLFIFAGVAVLDRFAWVMYIFGALLIFTAYRLVQSHSVKADPEKNPLVRFARRHLPVDVGYIGPNFTVKNGSRRVLTPLVIALVAVESADLIFALDSVPAVLAISNDLFVVYTSNIFAILGLRALYFALVGSLGRFEYLNWGLAIVLGFVGFKMLLSEVLHVPIYLSLLVVVGAVGGAVLASILITRDQPTEERSEDQ